MIFGDQIYGIFSNYQGILFKLGNNLQLSFHAYDEIIKLLNNDENITFKISYPIGLKPDNTLLRQDRLYKKEDLIKEYQNLYYHDHALSNIYHLVTFTETFLIDLCKLILNKYPQKIPKNKEIKWNEILSCNNIQSLKNKIIDEFLIELSYQKPADYAEQMENIFSYDLKEIPQYYKYIELKATRDTFIHNNGIINTTYLHKSGSHTRGKLGEKLILDIPYFLSSYESCLQLSEDMMFKFNEKWQSIEYEKSNYFKGKVKRLFK